MARQEEWFKQHSGRIFGGIDAFVDSRKVVAQKILARMGGNHLVKDKVLLDVGCSVGLITEEYAKYCKKAYGIDIDKSAIKFAEKKCKKAKCVYYEGKKFPFPDKFFDVIICNFVIEHVENQKLLMNEIYRVLKSGGKCYISTDNKLRIMEAHYKLPFLSYLPKPLAGIYLRVMGKGTAYYEKLPTYWQFKQLCHKFKIEDRAMKILRDPKKYHVKKLGFWTRNFLVKLNDKRLRKFLFLLPSFNFVLTK